MSTSNVIPLNGAADLARQHSLPVCTVLTPKLALRLQALNELTRRLRAAGVRVEAASPLDATIFIAADHSQRLAEVFSSEWRGVAWSTKGSKTINSVHIAGCRVCWLTPAKEPGQ